MQEIYLPPPRVVLPKSYQAVVGDTLQLFYRGIVEHPNPYIFNIEFISDIGAVYPRYFEITPSEDDVGEHKLTVNVRLSNDTVIAAGECIIEVVRVGDAPQNEVTVLAVGDSLTRSGVWVNEAYRRLTSHGGNPEGNGIPNVKFIGSVHELSVGYEGYGGWKWESYLKDYDPLKADMFITTHHNKTARDMHSLWKDEGGAIWSLETIYPEKIKFTRYENHRSEMPSSGTLVHYKNAEHDEDIIIDGVETGPANPFYDQETRSVNFKSYAKRQGVEKIDYLYTLLTWNGLGAYHMAADAVDVQVKNAKTFLRLFHGDFPDAKVKLMGIPYPSVNGGTGASYGAGSVYSNAYGLCRQVMEMNIAYRELSESDEFSHYVEFINVSGQFDAEYSMPSKEKSVNLRSTEKEVIGTNGVHPTNGGYLQIADAASRNMVARITIDKRKNK